jgi:hypothetical protein
MYSCPLSQGIDHGNTRHRTVLCGWDVRRAVPTGTQNCLYYGIVLPLPGGGSTSAGTYIPRAHRIPHVALRTWTIRSHLLFQLATCHAFLTVHSVALFYVCKTLACRFFFTYTFLPTLAPYVKPWPADFFFTYVILPIPPPVRRTWPADFCPHNL